MAEGMSRRGMILAAGALATGPAFARAIDNEKTRAGIAAWRNAPGLRLWPDGPPGGAIVPRSAVPAGIPDIFLRDIAVPELRIFRPRTGNGRALLVVPGGGYAIVSVLNEGVEVAKRMTERGYTVFVLAYRLPGEGWGNRADVPLQDAQRAMRIIRDAAPCHGFDPAAVAVLGFSAGGHLAASLATAFAEPVYAPRDAIDRLAARPAAAGLVYPVIVLDGPSGHGGSRDMLLGPQADAALMAKRSPARHVDRETPPLFLVHALDDGVVPLRNSIAMIEAAKAAGHQAEAHLFAKGGHGFGLSVAGTRAATWPGLFQDWLDEAMTAGGGPEA